MLPVVRDVIEAVGSPRPPGTVRVAVVLPLSGSLGLCGPSALNCARLAASQINERGGLAGREVELVVVDGGGAPADAAAALRGLLRLGGIEAVLGMHTSDVRVALADAVGARVPYVYTPPYEGGERTPGVFLAGETPRRQVAPALAWLGRHRRVSRWFLVGNDYVWPRRVHAAATAFAAAAGQRVVGECYVPLGTEDFGPVIAEVADSGADAVLMSLVGADLVAFNRQARDSGLARRVVRLSASLEENGLLGMGGDDTGELYAAMGYFSSLATDDALSFGERYRAAFGATAPVLNGHGQSCYEGMLLLDAVVSASGSLRVAELMTGGVGVRGARGPLALRDRHLDPPVYLARARGLEFEVVAAF